MGTCDIPVRVSDGALSNKYCVFPWTGFSLFKFPIYLPQYAYFGELFQTYFKMSAHHIRALYSLCPFLPLQSTVSRKIKRKPRQKRWFLRRVRGKYTAVSLNTPLWILQRSEPQMREALKDALLLLLHGQTLALSLKSSIRAPGCITPACPEGISVSPASASLGADEPKLPSPPN